MRYLTVLASFVIILSSFSFLNAQPWKDKLGENERNFYKIQGEFNKLYEGKTPERGLEAENEEKEDESWMIYKRWEWFWEQRVYPSGELPPPDILSTRMKEYALQDHKEAVMSSGWTLIGPAVVPANEGGAGRVNCVAIHPNNNNIIFAGSASGGLWKSTDGGTSWTTNTDAFGSLGITAIVFNPTDPNIMYIATGDGDAGDTYSVGVLKSTDGGTTWNTTGLNYSTSSTITIRALVQHPTLTNLLLATTSNGIYRTTNAGVNWSPVASGSYRDLHVNLSDPTIWYASRDGVGVYKSTTSGATFSLLSGVGLPTTNFGRIALAVSESNPSTIYALYVNNSSGFYGLYKTTTAGTSWALQSNTPNILSWDGTGTDGQGWYDLTLDIDPENPAIVYVGGINMYKSTTNGTTWTKITHWYSGAGYPYIHADQHGFTFHPADKNTIYVGNDGGVFRSTNGGSTWSNLSGGLAITQFYRFGNSATNANRIIAGAQDNGTDLVLNGTWAQVIGGDGMEALIDYSNENIGYGELYYGDVYRTTNGGSSFSPITGSIPESGGWVTPYIINPINPASLYLGTTKVYRTRNRGTSWTAISGALTGSTLASLAIAKSDTNWIYAADRYSMFRTTNGGAAWTNITSGLPTAAITYITIHPNDRQKVYVTFSGYGSQKVYKTTDGGATWANISSGLPGIPVNCVAIHPTATDNIYVGTDVGVYSSTDAGSSWHSFSLGLPNVIVNELEFHAATNKLRAATYGRGIWEIGVGAGTGSISGTVFFDANNNGSLDLGETGLHNWSVHLSGDSVASQLTGLNGNYAFTNLPDGQYTVTIDQQGGWTLHTPSIGSYTVTITNGTNAGGKNFVNYFPGIYENFDGGVFPPIGWTRQTVAGDSGWRATTVTPRSGTAAALSHSHSSGTPGSAFLVTKRIALGAGLKELRFWARRENTQDLQPDTLKVKISTGDSLPSSFTTLYACYSGDTTIGNPDVYSTVYEEFVVSLNGYSGPVYLAFDHEENNGQTLYLDDVMINVGSMEPVFSSVPDSLSFGYAGLTVQVRDSIVVTNIGATTMTISSAVSTSNQFFVTPVNATLGSFASRTFYITFYATSGGVKNGYIVFTSNTSSSPDSVPVHGIGAVPQFSLSASSLSFGSVKIGQQVAETVKVSNSGTASLAITSVSSGNPQFIVMPTSGTVAMDDSLSFIVSFAPQAMGVSSANISFTHNAPGSPSILTATGTGVTPGFFPSTNVLPMGKVLVGQAKTDSFTVSNFSDVPLSISSVISTDPQYSVLPTSGTIDPSSGMTFVVVFNPVSIGSFPSALIFSHDGTTSPDTVLVRGNGADTVKFRTFTVDTALAAKPVRIKVAANKPAVKPNVANWRDTVVYRFDKRKGIALGLPQTGRAAMNYGWIRFMRGSDIARFFKIMQTNSAYNAPFDTVRKEGSNKKKKFVRELRPASNAYTNPLAQAFTVFKLNLYSSKLGITPKGLDSLVYVSSGSPWNEMTLTQIANRVDSVLTYYKAVPLPGGTFASVGAPELENIRTLMNDVNGAFYFPIALAQGDSVVKGQGLKFPGMVGLQTIPFLDKPGATIVEPLNSFSEDASYTPSEFALYQNYPNPFNPSTMLSFVIGHSSLVSLTVYDVLGREIVTLVNEDLDAGEYNISWDAAGQPSGVYFYRLTATPSDGSTAKFTSVRKLLLVK